mmetsp:Transcript_1101/g.2179  ORF Transcript_1101/g.2179 Transcript_1101/m.2179 type:complete len:91 (-) Transcript_1101:1018-1290(-)
MNSPTNTKTPMAPKSATVSSTETIDASPATPSPPAVIGVTHDSEDLRMKPDVAAVILTLRQQQPFVDGQDDDGKKATMVDHAGTRLLKDC